MKDFALVLIILGIVVAITAANWWTVPALLNHGSSAAFNLAALCVVFNVVVAGFAAWILRGGK